MKLSFSKLVLARIKLICLIFSARYVIVDGVKYVPPKEK